jgi:hypothetical protein
MTFTRAGGLPGSVGLSGVESASPNIIDDSFGALRAVRPGIVAVLALGTDNNVVDYVNLLVLDTDRIAIRAAEQQPSCATADCYDVVAEGGAFILIPGQPVNVQPQPFSHGQLLGGALQYTWESEDPEILEVGDGFDGDATLIPNEVGDVNLLVTGGGITQVIALHVTEPPPRPDDSTTGGEPGTGTDTGSGTDSGSGTDGSGTDSGSGSSSGTDTGTGSGSGSTGGM